MQQKFNAFRSVVCFPIWLVWLILVIAFCKFSTSFAGEKPKFSLLTARNGLEGSGIFWIHADRHGFVWIVTSEGINRYDGIHCLANEEIAPGAEGMGRYSRILETSDGDIWLGGDSVMVRYSYRLNRFEKVDVKSQIPASIHLKHVEPLAEISPGLIIFHVNWAYDIKAKKVVTLGKIPSDQYDAVVFPSQKRDAASLRFMGVKNEPDKTMKLEKFTINKDGLQQTTALTFPAEGLSYIILEKNADQYIFYPDLKELDFQSKSLRPAKKLPPDVKSIFWDLKNRLWRLDNRQLVQMNPADFSVIRSFDLSLPEEPGIVQNVMSVHIDKNDNVYLGFLGKGLAKFNLNRFHLEHAWNKPESEKAGIGNVIRGIREDSKGNIWMLTPSNVLVQLNARLQLIRKFPSNQFGKVFENSDFILDEQDKIYIEGDSRLIRFDPETNEKKFLHEGGFNRKFYQFCKLRNGAFLGGCYDGLRTFTSKSELITPLPGLNPYTDLSTCTYEDKQGYLYNCTNTRGFEVIQFRQGKYEVIRSFHAPFDVKHFEQTNDSTVWIATNIGLYEFDNKHFKYRRLYDKKDGLPSRMIYSLCADDYGHLWMGTGQGISVLDLASRHWNHFTEEDGIQESEFNTHVALKTRDGRLIFGGVNGLNVIHPEKYQINRLTPGIVFTTIKTDSLLNPFGFESPDAVLEVAPGSNILEFGFTAIEHSNPQNCQLRYRLTNYDKNWISTSNPGNIRYTNVPAGDYVLEIQAANSDGIWSSKTRTLKVQVQQFWFRTWTFRILFSVFVVLIVYLVIRQIIRTQVERQRLILEKQRAVLQERERIVADLHDDVGSSLSSIQLFSSVAEKMMDNNPEKTRQVLQQINRNSQSTINSLSDIVWAMKAEQPGFSMESRLKNFAVELLEPKGIEIEFRMKPSPDELFHTVESRKNALLLMKEALHNIAKYSGARHVVVSIEKVETGIQLVIADDGIGFDMEQHRQGNGLGTMKKRAEELGGRIGIETSPGNGCRILVSLPHPK